MSLWIQIDTQRSSNRKTYVLAELLSAGAGDLFGGRDEIAWRAVAIALLDDFWSYVAEHHPDGDVTKAHPASLRKPLIEWLQGTEWLRKDVRELLVKSGHLDRRPDGRLFVHDWMEWTGGSVLKLAKDRKRKRLARGKSPRKRPRTVRDPEPGVSTPGPVLAVQSSAVQSSPILSSPKTAAAPRLDFATRCVIAVNQVLDQQLAGAFSSLVADVERPVAEAWEAEGIPIETAEMVLRETTARFPTPRGRQPHSLRYFDAAVREAGAKAQAAGAPRPLKDHEVMAQLAEDELRAAEDARRAAGVTSS